jgi:hypothetical protein
MSIWWEKYTCYWFPSDQNRDGLLTDQGLWVSHLSHWYQLSPPLSSISCHPSPGPAMGSWKLISCSGSRHGLHYITILTPHPLSLVSYFLCHDVDLITHLHLYFLRLGFLRSLFIRGWHYFFIIPIRFCFLSYFPGCLYSHFGCGLPCKGKWGPILI